MFIQFILCLFIFFVLTIHVQSFSYCPNKCNGHGFCETAHGSKTCFCFPGFHGPDCSTRLCPAGKAWIDYPQKDNVAHGDFVECSNMGICNRASGICECREGYTGAACDQCMLIFSYYIVL